MEELFGQLTKIEELLEHSSTITTNQTTVLLQSLDESEELELIETMVGYKDELIGELENVEKQFDKAYAENKAQVTSKAYIAQFKKRVAAILEKKQSIQEAEKNNVAIMRVRASKSKEQIKIPKAAEVVAAAYKKQQTKS